MAEAAASVLDVRDLKTVFRTRGGEIHAVNDVSFHLKPGELLGVVGESGSGKSVTMMSLLRLLPAPPADIRSGQVLLTDSRTPFLLPHSAVLPSNSDVNAAMLTYFMAPHRAN